MCPTTPMKSMLYQHITAVVTQPLTCLSTCSEVATEVFCLKAASNPGGGGRWLRELAHSVETTVNGKRRGASQPAFCSHAHRASLKPAPLHPIGMSPIP